jgi:hypothetical protein
VKWVFSSDGKSKHPSDAPEGTKASVKLVREGEIHINEEVISVSEDKSAPWWKTCTHSRIAKYYVSLLFLSLNIILCLFYFYARHLQKLNG